MVYKNATDDSGILATALALIFLMVIISSLGVVWVAYVNDRDVELRHQCEIDPDCIRAVRR